MAPSRLGHALLGLIAAALALALTGGRGARA
jgi:hypothetical protein